MGLFRGGWEGEGTVASDTRRVDVALARLKRRQVASPTRPRIGGRHILRPDYVTADCKSSEGIADAHGLVEREHDPVGTVRDRNGLCGRDVNAMQGDHTIRREMNHVHLRGIQSGQLASPSAPRIVARKVPVSNRNGVVRRDGRSRIVHGFHKVLLEFLQRDVNLERLPA